jgi:hypothetical protein
MMLVLVLIISVILNKLKVTLSNSLLTVIVCHNEVKVILA